MEGMSRLTDLLQPPEVATVVVRADALDSTGRQRLRAWMGLSEEAMQAALAEETLPLTPPMDPTQAQTRAAALVRAGLPAEAERSARPFARPASLIGRLGGLGALLYGVASLILWGLGDLIGTMPDPAVVGLILLPGVGGYAMMLAGLPIAMMLLILGGLRQRSRQAALQQTTQKLARLQREALPGAAGRLQQHGLDLSRRVVEAGLPAVMEADLLTGLSDCLDALPGLSRSLVSVEQALEGSTTPELEAAHLRLTGTLTEVAARVSMVEAGLAELAANTVVERGAANESALASVKKTAAALQGLAREMR